jgi:hypothetical protein
MRYSIVDGKAVTKRLLMVLRFLMVLVVEQSNRP